MATNIPKIESCEMANTVGICVKHTGTDFDFESTTYHASFFCSHEVLDLFGFSKLEHKHDMTCS